MNRWIPCQSRLPEEGIEVLLSLADHVEAGYLDDAELELFRSEFSGQALTAEDVKAWMPLPEPYREERTEE